MNEETGLPSDNICQVDTNTGPPDTTKFFSTHVCGDRIYCEDEEGDWFDECRGECLSAQLLDFEETLQGWFDQSKTTWYGVSNVAIVNDDQTYGRDSGYLSIPRVKDLLDFLVHLVGDFSIRYEVPELGDKEFHFWQDSRSDEGWTEDFNWVRCKVFHSVAR